MPFVTTPEGAAAGGSIRQLPVRWALAALSLSMLLSSLGISIVNIALPTLANVFGAPFQHVQWVVLAYLLTITTLVVSVGRLGDIVGRRRLLLAGILVFTVGSALGAVAPSVGSAGGWTSLSRRWRSSMAAAAPSGKSCTAMVSPMQTKR